MSLQSEVFTTEPISGARASRWWFEAGGRWGTGPHMESDQTNPADPKQPEPGQDSRVEDWHGQSVAKDAELAEELVAEHGEEKAEELFDEQAEGESVQAARHGDSIDPEQGQSAYKDA